MRITFAGTGCGATLNPDRAGAGIHVSAGDTSLLLDCGPGVIDRILRAEIDHTAIGHVLFSHLHSDHAIGIAELLFQFSFRRRPLPVIYGPEGTDSYLAAAIEFVQANTGPRLAAEKASMAELGATLTRQGDERELGSVQVRTCEVPHVDYLECLARRLDVGGSSMVYSGDTRPAPEVLVPLADGVDVLIHEAYTEAALEQFASPMPEKVQANIHKAFESSHSDAVAVGKLAAESGTARLVLTHLLPQESDAGVIDACAQHFKGEIVVAHDGLGLEV